MIETDEQKAILEELAQFTGTERYYRSTFGGLLLTDGVHYLRERLECYWLIDIVESYQPELKNVPIQLWNIDKKKNDSAIIEAREDIGLDALVSQKIPYTDFKLDSYEFFCIDKVVLLKSEY